MDAETMKMLAVGLIGSFGLMAPSLAEGYVAGKTMEGVSRNPENSGTMFSNMLVAMAVCESCGIYALVICLILLFV